MCFASSCTIIQYTTSQVCVVPKEILSWCVKHTHITRNSSPRFSPNSMQNCFALHGAYHDAFYYICARYYRCTRKPVIPYIYIPDCNDDMYYFKWPCFKILQLISFTSVSFYWSSFDNIAVSQLQNTIDINEKYKDGMIQKILWGQYSSAFLLCAQGFTHSYMWIFSLSHSKCRADDSTLDVISLHLYQ